MYTSLKALTLGVSASMALGTSAFAITEVDASVSALYFYDLETGKEMAAPDVNQDQHAITITETVYRPKEFEIFHAFEIPEGEMEMEMEMYFPVTENMYQNYTVEYTVHNNMAGWDIVRFGVSNPSYNTYAYVDRDISCSSFEGAACWMADTFRRGVDYGEEFDSDLLSAALGDENSLHVYSFVEADPEEAGPQDEGMSENVSAIMAGSTMGGFFFDHGTAASNMIGVATNGNGQAMLFSNLALQTTAVPIPAGALLLSTGLLGLGVMRKKRT